MAMALLSRAASAAAAAGSFSRPQLPSLTSASQPQPSCSPGRQWSSFGTRRTTPTDNRRRVSMAALPDLHSLTFLAVDLVKLTDLEVGVELDPTRGMILERSSWEMGETAIKTFYMMFSLVFCWGCCVFGSMNDVFYDSEMYRKAGGNGTGHWIYDQQDREERAAREEIWSEDLVKEIEEKAEKVRKAEEEEEEKEVELV